MREIFYFFLKQYCRCALWFYFKKWQVQNKNLVPSGPVIFVANHQNAFLDAVLVGSSCNRNPWFLARANVFQKRWAQIVLEWLKMKPVFRFRDGFHSLRKSDEMIASCVALLQQNKSILIFAEGNHNERWSLRPLQKGFVRIALAAKAQQVDVKIVPVGLQYESHGQSGSRVMVSFGSPLFIPTGSLQDTNDKQEIDFLLTETSHAIRSLMLHIDPVEYEQRLHFLNNHRTFKSDLVEQLKTDQLTLANYDGKKIGVQRTALGKSASSNLLYHYVSINHFLPKKLINFIINQTVDDSQFIVSVKFATGMIIVPFFYILQSGFIYLLSQSVLVSLFYFCSLPLSYKALSFFTRTKGQRKNNPVIGPTASSTM